ncbi:MAG: RusA family crossover junction endodeoxyribonuclease [Elusimicrobia bacterium]|nr:RusA family crossover junction endodeoxyribonuclease [Elusimicrobiota bacterium]
MIRFFVPGNPVAQARPRTFWHKAAGRFITMNPRKSEDWKEHVRLHSLPHRPRKPMDFPVRAHLDFYLPRPKGSKNKVWACTRPDLDNFIKGTLDALQSAGFFVDDSRVVWLECHKLYSAHGHVGVQVSIFGVDEKA